MIACWWCWSIRLFITLTYYDYLLLYCWCIML